MMLRIAVVEDNKQDAERLRGYLMRYQEDARTKLGVTLIPDGLTLLDDYTPSWDILFLDIQMTHLDGMQTARRVREVDPEVVIIFTTCVSHYAVQGYLVDALAYLLKPVSYAQLAFQMDKAVRILRSREHKSILLTREGQKIRVPTDEILFVEVLNHNIHIVTERTEYRMRGSLQEIESALANRRFAKCSQSYLVNLCHVEQLNKDTVEVGGHTLPVSRPKKKQFLRELSEYLGVEV